MAAPDIGDFIVECPHCHTSVIPKDNGECPACLKNMSDLSGVDPNVTSLTISQGQTLPAICFRCGRAARSTHRVVAKRKNPYVQSRAWEVLIIGILFAPLVWLYRRFFGSIRDRLEIRLPLCDGCAVKEGRDAIKPIHIDFDNYEMTFLVHKDFSAAAIANKKQ